METTNEKLTGQYRQLHQEQPNYGASSIGYVVEMALLIDYLKPEIVLDYGCGKGALMEALSAIYPKISFHGYDPSIPGLEKLPVHSADLVINTDVLEHIPAELIPNVLAEISSISKNAVFGCHHALARATLADGTNAHCTVRPPFWYQTQIMHAFGDGITVFEGRGPHLSLIATFPVYTKTFNDYTNILRHGKDWQMKKKSLFRRLVRHVKSMKS